MSARWTESEEDFIFVSRERGIDWRVISERLPGRSESHCRDYYEYWASRRAVEDRFILKLRGRGAGWDEIAEQIPERSSFSCSEYYKHHQDLQTSERAKTQFSVVYHRLKGEMWKQIGDELGVGWRAAEAMHWQLGERELERRANLTAGARGEEHTNHPYQARGKEQSEAGFPDAKETRARGSTVPARIVLRNFVTGPSLQKEVAGNTYVLTSNQFNAHSANGELRLNPR